MDVRPFALIALLATGACVAPIPNGPVPSAPSAQSVPARWDTTDRLVSPVTRESLARLASNNPNSAITQRRRLQLALQQGDFDGAAAALDRMSAMELSLSAEAYRVVGQAIGADGVADDVERAEGRAEPLTASREVAAIPADIMLSEAFAFDEATGRWFAGSIVERSLHVSDDGRSWRWVATGGLGSVAGLAIDPATRTLWIASGRLDQTKRPEEAFVGLVALDLDTMKEKRRITAPRAIATLGDLAVTADGTVLVSDPVGSGVYRLGPGRGQLETLVEPRHFASPQGIAVHPSGRFAYVADWAYGVALVDLETRAIGRLAGSETVALDGVDGMAWYDGSLIVIQNGLNPHRIVRWLLSEDGFAVRSAQLLERAHPDWGEPTVGQLVGSRFFYASDPQWDRFAKGGAQEGDAPLRPNPIRAIDL